MNSHKIDDDPAAGQGVEEKCGVHHRSIVVTDNCIDSRELFVAGREIIIVHGAEQYRLRLTSQRKLILTK